MVVPGLGRIAGAYAAHGHAGAFFLDQSEVCLDAYVRRNQETRFGALGDSLVQGMLDGLSTELPTLPLGTWVGPQVPHQ